MPNPNLKNAGGLGIGPERLDQIKHAIVERSGEISIVPRKRP